MIPKRGAYAGGAGQQGHGRPRLKEPLVDVSAGQQGGQGAADGDQAKGLHHAGDGLA
ncbi:hypothetical protein GCM10018771_46570 [Streptomyces cellulosae]|nr:hypothetical protein GCM10018771_46570 [Streptomyces cellulosae]